MHPAAPALELNAVTRRFEPRARAGAAFTAIESLSFSVRPRRVRVRRRPVGLRQEHHPEPRGRAGPAERGRSHVSGEAVTGPNAHVGFMLQKDLLLPWRNIRRNVEFGLEARGLTATERAARVARELARCRLEDYAERYPHQLSGGQRQRAALARTLAIDPDLVLLDEPFSALDAQTKLVLQRSFARTIAASGVTTLLITHDLNEAVAMSDRILVMSERPGRIVEEIEVGLPGREDPIARQSMPRARELMAHLFGALHLDERADV